MAGNDGRSEFAAVDIILDDETTVAAATLVAQHQYDKDCRFLDTRDMLLDDPMMIARSISFRKSPHYRYHIHYRYLLTVYTV